MDGHRDDEHGEDELKPKRIEILVEELVIEIVCEIHGYHSRDVYEYIGEVPK